MEVRLGKKTEAILEEALRKSEVAIATLPEARSTQRAHCANVVIICRDLVAARQACEPSSVAVAELGRARYGKFPAGQTLLNRYGELLRIWREAYSAVIDANAHRASTSASGILGVDEDLSGLDAGTKARVHLMSVMLRESKTEVDRLKRLITASIPAPGFGTAADPRLTVDSARVAPLRAWLKRVDLKETGFDVSPAGLLASTRLRPKSVALNAELLECLRELAAEPAPKRRGVASGALEMLQGNTGVGG